MKRSAIKCRVLLQLVLAGALALFSTRAAEGDPSRVEAIHQILMRIVMPNLEFRDASAREVIDFFKQKTVTLDQSNDPAKKGVGITLRLPTTGPVEAAPAPKGAVPGLVELPGLAGLPGVQAAPATNSKEPPEEKISLHLRNIPLWEALRYSAELAHLKLSVGERTLELSPEDPAKAVDMRAERQHRSKTEISAGAPGSPRAEVTKKLQSIIIPKAEFREATCREALDWAMRISPVLDVKEPDPARKGVNIVYVPDGAIKAVQDEVPIYVAVRNTTMGKFLREVAEKGNLDLAIEDYAVVLRARARKP